MSFDDTQQQSFDVLIAGAGMAGVLAAVRLAEAFPEARIALVEKASKPGGRLRTSQKVRGEWNCGLAAVSPELFDFIDNSLKSDPEGRDLSELIPYRQQQVALLSGSHLEQVHTEELFTPSAAKALGGGTAAREWAKVEELWQLEDGLADLPFNKLWKHPRKNAAAVVLAHFTNFCGVTDLWSSIPQSLKERMQYIRSGLYFGPWEEAMEALLQGALARGNLQLLDSCRIVEANWSKGQWQISTEKGDLASKALIVAQPPWQANDWLDRKECPVPVLNLALKAKPTSAVILSEKVINGDEAGLADLTLISAESVLAINPGDGSLCLQAVIDFELSLDAPSVVKAIKRLRRASKKLKKALPSLETAGEYIALRPVAWAQSTAYTDRKNWERLSDMSKVQQAHLAFCGDAYGSAYQPDENLVKSVTSACSVIGGSLEEKKGR